MKEWIVNRPQTPTDAFRINYRVKKIIFSKKSKFQKIEIIENSAFGRMLFLDNDVQIADKDAHIYNQEIVSPLVKAGKASGSVLILGNGDGGILFELLKHNPSKVVLVDIDEEVIKACKKFLPKVCGKAFDDNRVEIVIDDANNFLEKNAEKNNFDAVIYDLTLHPEVFTKTPRETYLKNLFAKVRKNLKEKGILSVQCCSHADLKTPKLLEKILKKEFSEITFWQKYVPSFCEAWVFASAKAK